jgi:hypothetical protein
MVAQIVPAVPRSHFRDTIRRALLVKRGTISPLFFYPAYRQDGFHLYIVGNPRLPTMYPNLFKCLFCQGSTADPEIHHGIYESNATYKEEGEDSECIHLLESHDKSGHNKKGAEECSCKVDVAPGGSPGGSCHQVKVHCFYFHCVFIFVRNPGLPTKNQ